MANKACIRIHQDRHLEYLVLNADGTTLLSGSAFHNDQLPAFPSHLEVSLIVPGTDVLLLEMTMPKTSRSQLEKALPYALEEQLIEDLDDLHFVASKQDDDGNLHVLIVRKALLSMWITRCTELGLYPKIAIPDYLALAPLQDAWHLYLDNEQAILRQQWLGGLTIEQTQLHEILSLNLAEQQELGQQTIVIDYDDANEHFDTESLSNLNLDINFANEHYFCMEMFAKGLTTPPALNLLTGDYLLHKRKDRKSMLWKWVLILIAAWVATWFATELTTYFVFHSRLNTVNQQVTALYKKAFPQAQSVVSPRIRIERALKGTQAAGGVFLTLLTQVGQQIKQQNANVTIENLNFRNNTLILAVNADNFQTLATLSNSLQAQGLSVQQQNASTQGKTVSAQLVIKSNSNG
jgi:general secretion pathway protein L